MSPEELELWEEVAELTARMAAAEAALLEYREASLALMARVGDLAQLRAEAAQKGSLQRTAERDS